MGSPYLLSGARTRDMGEKIYLTYEQQVEKLRRDGLIVDDEKAAVARLKWEGYYNFAVGYNRLFKDDKKRYIRGVRFGQDTASAQHLRVRERRRNVRLVQLFVEREGFVERVRVRRRGFGESALPEFHVSFCLRNVPIAAAGTAFSRFPGLPARLPSDCDDCRPIARDLA